MAAEFKIEDKVGGDSQIEACIKYITSIKKESLLDLLKSSLNSKSKMATVEYDNFNTNEKRLDF